MAEASMQLPRRRRPVLRFAVTMAAAFAIMLLIMVVFENSLIYFPSRYPDGYWEKAVIATRTGCLIEDCEPAAEDGVRLHAWWCHPPQEASGPTRDMVLLWFHGNAGNLSHRVDMMVKMARSLPVQVLIVDYRGYGKSQGRPSEQGLYRDARAAWRYLVEERGVASDRIVIFGKSLGGAAAVDLATRVRPAGLIVQSSFSSIRDMAAHHFPFVPRFLVRSKMDSVNKVPRIDCPKLFVHSPSDEVVPYRLGRRLYEAAAEPKSFYEVVGSGHNETYLVGGGPYWAALREFVTSCLPDTA